MVGQIPRNGVVASREPTVRVPLLSVASVGIQWKLMRQIVISRASTNPHNVTTRLGFAGVSINMAWNSPTQGLGDAPIVVSFIHRNDSEIQC
jgi:hypothetical protein